MGAGYEEQEGQHGEFCEAGVGMGRVKQKQKFAPDLVLHFFTHGVLEF